MPWLRSVPKAPTAATDRFGGHGHAMPLWHYDQNHWSGLCAAASMIMIPTPVVYVLFQGQIQQGITVLALKG